MSMINKVVELLPSLTIYLLSIIMLHIEILLKMSYLPYIYMKQAISYFVHYFLLCTWLR